MVASEIFNILDKCSSWKINWKPEIAFHNLDTGHPFMHKTGTFAVGTFLRCHRSQEDERCQQTERNEAMKRGSFRSSKISNI